MYVSCQNSVPPDPSETSSSMADRDPTVSTPATDPGRASTAAFPHPQGRANAQRSHAPASPPTMPLPMPRFPVQFQHGVEPRQPVYPHPHLNHHEVGYPGSFTFVEHLAWPCLEDEQRRECAASGFDYCTPQRPLMLQFEFVLNRRGYT